MGRTAARRAYTLDDLARQTAGVECRKDSGMLDETPACSTRLRRARRDSGVLGETPAACQDIEQVMADQADLVEVVAHLRQVVCVKG